MSGLRGRDAEVAHLRHAVRVAQAGSGRVVVVEGEAGLGKSSLLAAATGAIAGRPVMVAQGAADERDAGRPFRLWFEALGISARATDPRRQRIAALIGGWGDDPTDAGAAMGGAPAERYLAQEGLAELIDELSLESPMAIALDDLQWADSGSLLVLVELVRRLRDLPVALLLATRPWPRRPELASLLDRIAAADGLVLRVGPLDGGAVEEMADDLVGAAPGPALRDLLATAAGNPFYVRELLLSADAAGRLVRREGTADVVGFDVPLALHERILHRLATLPDETLDVLRVLAAVGGGVDQRDLIDIVGRSAVNVLQATAVLRQIGLVVERDGRLSFQHDIVRETVRNDVPPTERSLIQSQMAQVLIARDADPLEIAPHLVGGAAPGDRQAVDWLQRAARRVTPADPQAGAGLYLRAAELLADDVDARVDVTVEAVRALAWAGRFDEAAQHGEAAIALGPSSAVAQRVRIGLVEVQLLTGRVGDTLGPLREAAGDLSLDDELRANLWAEAASAALWSLDLAGAERDARVAIELADRIGAPNPHARALGVLSRRMNLLGRITESRHFGDLCLDVAGDDSLAQRATPHLYAGMALWPVDADGSEVVLREGLRRAERLGLAWALPVYMQALVSSAFDAADWDGALTYYDTARELLADKGDLDELSMEALVAILRFYRNELPEVRRILAFMLERADQPQARVGGEIYIRWLQALVLEHDGDRLSAANLLINACELCELVEATHVQLPFVVDAVRWGIGTELHDRALDRVRLARELAERGGMPIHESVALRCEALARGDADSAVRAVEVLAPTTHRFDFVLACEDAGTTLLGAGRPAEARAVFERGLAAADVFGARLLARRMQAGLRAAGGGRGVRGRRQRPASGWQSLTEVERQVVALVREGLTNAMVGERLFIGRRTVETHLVHIYGKVGLPSRQTLIESVAPV